jgi:hypothetical protein
VKIGFRRGDDPVTVEKIAEALQYYESLSVIGQSTGHQLLTYCRFLLREIERLRVRNSGGDG